jgi:hypothetical protein
LRALLTAVATVLAVLPAAAPRPRAADLLAATLRGLYAESARPGERWRRRSVVRLPDGRELPRELAYRDDPRFAGAAGRLLASRAGDDAPLGAWLLGSLPPGRAGEAEPLLLGALRHPDPRAAFEAVQALARLGTPRGRAALLRLASEAAPDDVRTAAAWASGRVPAPPRGLAFGFRRGVSWWMSETGADAGASSFRRLASLGVTWVSIHTWDPLQRGLHDPVLAEGDRHFGFRDLGALVRSAHAAGLSVMVKPHLEMRGYEPSEEERRILRGTDEAARRALFRRFEAFEPADHNRIEMGSDSDWRRWFSAYEAYLLSYARQAEQAGADLFCVGRELDTSVARREGDWRRLIARVREVYHGPLTYSANFDTWAGIGFWDALDFIGVSGYFPLSDRPEPTVAQIEAGWDRWLTPLEAAGRRFGRPVLLTEAGFPSVPTAAKAPWREERTAADVALQARCYEATLRAIARRPWLEGAFFWLWERSAAPPFRDPSHAIEDKPASFTLARWYAR